MKTFLVTALGLLVLAGCSLRPLKPGRSGFIAPSGVAGWVQQSENPSRDTKQTYERVVECPESSKKVTERIETVVGSAQKDSAREIGARLASLKGVVWLGALVFLFGVASAFWPPLKVVIGSLTTSLMIAAAGLVLIVLPNFVVGNEILITSLALGGAALYWFSHRHGQLRERVNILGKKE